MKTILMIFVCILPVFGYELTGKNDFENMAQVLIMYAIFPFPIIPGLILMLLYTLYDDSKKAREKRKEEDFTPIPKQVEKEIFLESLANYEKEITSNKS